MPDRFYSFVVSVDDGFIPTKGGRKHAAVNAAAVQGVSGDTHSQ